jgi:hypothetical protein
MEEFEIAKKRGLFLLPIGATDGSAQTISDSLTSSAIVTTGRGTQRPTNAELATLADPAKRPDELADIAIRILNAFIKE